MVGVDVRLLDINQKKNLEGKVVGGCCEYREGLLSEQFPYPPAGGAGTAPFPGRAPTPSRSLGTTGMENGAWMLPDPKASHWANRAMWWS